MGEKAWEVKIEVIARGTTIVDAETEEEAKEEAEFQGIGTVMSNWTLDEYDEATLEVVSVTESRF